MECDSRAPVIERLRPMMKTMLAILLAGYCSTTWGQGTVWFQNYAPPDMDAPVYHSDGVTPLSGSQFLAELFGGPSATSLQAVATTTFEVGTAAGYFFGGAQYLPGVPELSLGWVQIDVWNTASGATFADALASGLPDSWWQSSIFSTATGGTHVINPFPPQYLVGLGTSPVFLNGVPEPSVFGLAGLCTVATALRCRSSVRGRQRRECE